MKLITPSLALLASLAMLTNATAAQKSASKPATKEVTAKTESTELPPPPAATEESETPSDATSSTTEGESTASGGPLSMDFGGLDFERIAADSIEYLPDGGLKLTGNAIFKSAQMNLDARDLVMNNKTKTMVANGGPVKLINGDVRAECRTLNYDIEKKQSRLTGSPIIFQRKSDGTVTQIRGETIIITQGKDGAKPAVSIQGGNPEIVKITDSASASKKPGTKTDAKKVTPENQDLIKVPEIE